MSDNTPTISPAAAPHRTRARTALETVTACLDAIPNLHPELRQKIVIAITEYGTARTDAAIAYMDEAWQSSIDRHFGGKR